MQEQGMTRLSDESPTLNPYDPVSERLLRARTIISHRNFWLDARAAIRHGLVGQIVERASDIDE
jgi:ATP-dependent protease ClpP protease subunit